MEINKNPLKCNLTLKMKKQELNNGINKNPFTNGYNTIDELFPVFSSSAVGTSLVMLSDSCIPGSRARLASITAPTLMNCGHAPQRRVRFLHSGNFLSHRSMLKLGLCSALRKSSPPGRDGGLLTSTVSH